MKQTKYIILLALVAVYPVTVTAMTAMVPGGQAAVIINTIESQFGLSGTVTGYYPSQALIEVNGIRYMLRSEGLAKEVDLSTGSQIRYNLEKSSAEQRGRVTQIWIEAEE